jgi:hypothetical protein
MGEWRRSGALAKTRGKALLRSPDLLFQEVRKYQHIGTGLVLLRSERCVSAMTDVLASDKFIYL